MDYERHYKQLFQPIEDRIGDIDEMSIAAIVGFDCGGPVRLCTVGHGRGTFVTYITADLSVRDEQLPASLGRYELMMTSDNEQFARRILTKIGQMSLESIFEHGHTVDIGQIVDADCPMQGLVVEEFDRITFDGQSFGLLRLHGVTRAELKFAMEASADELLDALEHAGIYPRTSVQRRESIDTIS